MSGTFAGIEIGKRSLMAHNVQIQTAGHNISNADTEGYSRQRVTVAAMDPLDRPDLERAELPGQLGQGTVVQSVTRVRDELLDNRIFAQTNLESYWNTRDNYYSMIEQIYNEPDEISVRSNMDKFWQAWQELSNDPGSDACRQAVVTRAESLTNSIQQNNKSLLAIQQQVNGDIEASVKQVNDITRQIAEVNTEIVRVLGMGDNPNDLMDRRDLLVERLGNLINVTVVRSDPDEFIVHTDGQMIVQGGIARQIDEVTDMDNSGYTKLIWHDTQFDASFRGGSLGALVELRDKDLRSELQSLDTMTQNFADLVNDVHRNAIGKNNVTGLDFFTEHPFVENTNGNYDRDGDGAVDHSYVFRFTGTNALRPQEQIGLAGTMTFSGTSGNITVEYYPTDTVSDVVNRINDSNGEVKAYLDRNSNLVLKATTAQQIGNPDFVIRHVEDSGMFLTGYAGILAGSGEAGAYDWERPDAVNSLAGADFAVSPIMHPSGYIVVNPTIASDVQSVAAAFANNQGRADPDDGRAAVEIAAIRNSKMMVGGERTFDDYFAETVTRIGLKGEQAENMLASQKAIMNDLRDLRDSISGVNVDEELADIIKFQYGYQAAAKFISVQDQLLNTLINRIGV
ncbi:MAG: flagellar hook-associated protein FlgK [Treponema sp.]|nr:flagellar hook-associated protein FlgK [Treponema sp.]